MTQPPTKTERAEAIARCVEMIAEHCGVPALNIIDPRPKHGKALRDAKALLVYHLHRCGMSMNSIGRILQRSDDYIQRIESHGAVRMMGSDMELVASLPMIPSSLIITKA